MRRSLKLALDEFGRATLEGEAARYRVSSGELVGTAVEYFLGDRDSGRPSLKVPRFARNTTAPELDVEVDLDGRTWDEAESEASRQRVPLERLLEHATMYLVADLDSGEVAERIAAESAITER